MDVNSGSDEVRQQGNPAVPGLAPDPVYDGPEQFFTVDGERFRVRRRLRNGSPYEYDYDWLTGPNPNYGFGVSGPIQQNHSDHVATIKDFLGNIDPATGYLR